MPPSKALAAKASTSTPLADRALRRVAGCGQLREGIGHGGVAAGEVSRPSKDHVFQDTFHTLDAAKRAAEACEGPPPTGG